MINDPWAEATEQLKREIAERHKCWPFPVVHGRIPDSPYIEEFSEVKESDWNKL